MGNANGKANDYIPGEQLICRYSIYKLLTYAKVITLFIGERFNEQSYCS